MQIIRWILRYIIPYKTLSVLTIVGLLINTAYYTISPLGFKYLIDYAFIPKNVDHFIFIISILVIGGAFSIMVAIGSDYTNVLLRAKSLYLMRVDFFSHLQTLPLQFYARYRIGDVIARFSSDISSVQNTIFFLVPAGISSSITIILSGVILFQLESSLTLVLILSTGIIFLGPFLLRKRARKYNQEAKLLFDQMTNFMDETIRGQKVIKGFDLRQLIYQRFLEHLRPIYRVGIQINYTNALMNRTPVAALMILSGIIMGYGGYLTLSGDLSIGSFVAFNTIFMSMGFSVSSLTSIIPVLVEARVSFERLQEVLTYPSEQNERSGGTPIVLQGIRSAIEFDHVSFEYPGSNKGLNDANLVIPAGNFVAIVGRNGSGKSTLFQLLLRFYQPQQGEIRIDGIPLNDIDITSFREKVSVVFQETFLFHASIRENIAIGKRNAHEEEIIEAAKAADLHEWILQLPEGYNTTIDPEGGNLSGGQRQRIAIARAILRKPELLLLDEVTTGLDPVIEAKINETIFKLSAQLTVISITHQLSSVVHADRIHVMHHGRFIEQGTHEELIQTSGLYKRMWEHQHKK